MCTNNITRTLCPLYLTITQTRTSETKCFLANVAFRSYNPNSTSAPNPSCPSPEGWTNKETRTVGIDLCRKCDGNLQTTRSAKEKEGEEKRKERKERRWEAGAGGGNEGGTTEGVGGAGGEDAETSGGGGRGQEDDGGKKLLPPAFIHSSRNMTTMMTEIEKENNKLTDKNNRIMMEIEREKQKMQQKAQEQADKRRQEYLDIANNYKTIGSQQSRGIRPSAANDLSPLAHKVPIRKENRKKGGVSGDSTCGEDGEDDKDYAGEEVLGGRVGAGDEGTCVG